MPCRADGVNNGLIAIKAGADVVFELPTVFATGNAEIFAKGAITLANAFSGEHVLCFGTENGTKQSLIATAKTLNSESKEFKRLYKEELKEGVTTVKAKVNALNKMNLHDVDCSLLQSPNNILGIEYTKAILSLKSKLDIYPIIREGAGYNDSELYKNISSASAIRTAILDGKVKKTKTNLPSYVYEDLPKALPICDELIYYSVLKATKQELKNIIDCTEGLENRIKALSKTSDNLEDLKDKLKTKRYTYTRISRILLSCMLGIEESFIRKCLSDELYLKVLAIDKNKLSILSEFSKMTDTPIITRKRDADALIGISKACFEKDVFANDVYGFVTNTKTNEYQMKTV